MDLDHLSDYVQWMGDFPISMTGFRDADALVLCALSHFDLSPVFSVSEHPTVRECQSMIEQNQVRVMITGADRGYPELLSAASASRRFGDLQMSDYRDVFRSEPPLQFSAVCFHDHSEFSFLAYRGTDNSLAGWKEDFMISFTRTEAQEMALRYAEEHITPDRHWYLGGHSKGSNLALYAACLMSDAKWSAVEHLYLLDGPGFCPEVLNLSLLDRIDQKATRVVPSFCIIGNLFAPKITDTRIVRSSAGSFMQHSLISWGIDHGRLALVKEHDRQSVIVSETLAEWISGISQTDRVLFVNELFQVLTAGGAETVQQILNGGWEGLDAILHKLSETSDTTKQALSNLPKYSRKVRLENLRKRLAEEREARRGNP